MEGDHDGDGKLSFEEFAQMVSNTVSHFSVVLHGWIRGSFSFSGHCEANDSGRPLLKLLSPPAIAIAFALVSPSWFSYCGHPSTNITLSSSLLS